MNTQRRMALGLALAAGLVASGCSDMRVRGQSSGRVYPPLKLIRVSARLEAPEFDKVRITRQAAKYEPQPTISSTNRRDSEVQVKALQEELKRGFINSLLPYAKSNGLRIMAKGPDVASLHFIPAAASTSCDSQGCVSWLDLKVELKGQDGTTLWTYNGSLWPSKDGVPDSGFDRLLRVLFEAMRRDAVLS